MNEQTCPMSDCPIEPKGDPISQSNDFRSKLTHLINRACLENVSNTPDFILAEYLCDCLEAFDKAVRARDKWYGIAPAPGWTCKVSDEWAGV